MRLGCLGVGVSSGPDCRFCGGHRTACRWSSAGLGVQPALQPVGELDWLVEVDEVTGAFDQVELRSGDGVRETMAPVDGNPGVIATPEDKNGKIEAWVQRFNLVGV